MSTPRISTLRIVLCASLAVNLALIFWVVQRKPTPEVVAGWPGSDNSNSKAPGAPVSRARPSSLPTIAAGRAGDAFRWDTLESSDYQTFINNLRRIGCPEETIRDLIVADVNKSFAPRMSAVARRASGNYWMSGQKRRQLTSEVEGELSKLNAERSQVLEQLLGANIDKHPPLEPATLIQEEVTYGFLNAEKRGPVRDLLRRYQEEEEALQRKSSGLLTTEDRDAWQALQTKRRAELAALLSPSELENYDLRTSSAAQNVRSKLGGLEVSEDDFREMYRIRKSYEETVAKLGEAAADGSDQRQLLRQQREEQLRGYLGEQRYAHYQKSQDFEYQDLSSIAARHNLPMETVDQAYAINQAAREQRNQVLNDPAISPERKKEALQAIQQTTDQELKNMLGKAGFQSYRERDRVVFEEAGGSGMRTIVSSTVDGSGTIIRRTIINEPPTSTGGPTRREVNVFRSPP